MTALPILSAPVPPEWPAWSGELFVWLAVAGTLVLLTMAVGIWTLVGRLRDLRSDLQKLDVLNEIDQKLGRLAADRDDLDLRRIEHVLIDLRDTQARLEDVFLRALELGRSDSTAAARDLIVPQAPDSVAERVTNRLLALGYERIQIVTRTEKLTELASKDGEVLVEARKSGVLHKGRVGLKGGRLADVELHPAYSIFP